MIRILSWNVNGFRAAVKKGFAQWMSREKPDILGIQEIKSTLEQLKGEEEEAAHPPEYRTWWNPAERPGYSGTALFSSLKSLPEPDEVITVLGESLYDVPNEGRVQIAVYSRAKTPFTLFHIYFPNGQMSQERLDYKIGFYKRFQEYALNLKRKGGAAGKNQVIMGDVNTAHREIDLKNPKANEERSGFLPIEREWIDGFLASGYHDTFRYLYPDKIEYSWWTYRFQARQKNIGWRIDYVYVSEELLPMVKDAFILTDVTGSDHCPVGISIDI